MGLKDATDAILSGCNDVLVTKHKDGTMKSTSFCVRFGRLKIRSRGKYVRLEVNGAMTNVFMVVGANGECEFVALKDVPEQYRESEEAGDDEDDESEILDKEQRYLSHKTQPSQTTPPHDVLVKMNLVVGRNDIKFLVSSRMRGTQVLYCRAYLVPHDKKIVISDVDGTITKSNVGGQIAGFLKKDFSHPGIAKFYSDLSASGHQIIYLTSRPITSNNSTREYIDSVRQEIDPVTPTSPPATTDGSPKTPPKKSSKFNLFKKGKRAKDESAYYRLPPGPVIACPDFVFEVLVREVVKKQPHLFKIPALLEVLEVFNFKPHAPRLNYGPEADSLATSLARMGIQPAVRDESGRFNDDPQYLNRDDHPFVAAFGNAPTDLLSYFCVGIPLDMVFIVNTRSQIRSGNTMPPMKEIDLAEYRSSSNVVSVTGWEAAMEQGSCLDVITAESRKKRRNTSTCILAAERPVIVEAGPPSPVIPPMPLPTVNKEEPNTSDERLTIADTSASSASVVSVGGKSPESPEEPTVATTA
eukprot:TRINITY_DN6975_c0_g5_i1.p1 TRINITY_DN6975_c0_g5~~TRINITY_DN6975_c0_g5_i1.p1  ORF type:complete len:527 (+),score=93.00 TRINITY_DN6975_c0_g5_i1:97-1677(+)